MPARIIDEFKYQDAASMDASFNGANVGLAHMRGFSIVAAWTETSATLAGDLTLEASNDGSVWSTISGSTVAVSGTGSTAWNHSDSYFKYVRIKWARTSGEGTITAILQAKDV